MSATTTRLAVRLEGMRPRSDRDGLNARRSWQAQRARSRLWRTSVCLAANVANWPERLPWERAVCTITTVAARGKEPDDDNAAGCAKSCRDSVAKWFGVSDAPSGPITWRYAWRRGPDATEITVEEDHDER